MSAATPSPEQHESSAEQLRLIADTAPVLIAHCDREHRYKFVNQQYAARFGLSREQVIGRRIPEVLGAEAYARIRPYLARVLAGEAVEFEISLPYQNRGLHHMRCAYAPESDAQGEVIGLVAAIVDITERKRMEEELRRNEAQYRAIGESIDYGIWICAPDGRNTYASESFLKLLGITQEQCSNFGWGDALHPDDAAQTIAAWQECVRTGGKWDREHRFRGIDGRWHHILARGLPVKDENGRILSWVGINLDISERKQAEAAVREREEKYRSLIQALPAAVYTCDSEGRIQLYNEAAVALWGREPDVARDLWCGSWRIYEPDGTPMPLENCPMARTLKGGRAVRGEELIIERPDGTRVNVVSYPELIRDAAGKVVGAVKMLADITDRKRAEEALEKAKEAAEIANRVKDRFLAVLSHELRTPLMPVMMVVNELAQDPDLRPEVREDLAMIKRNIELETKLIDDLLDLNRITSGKLPVHIEPVDLNKTIVQVCGICRSAAQTGGIRLETILDEAAGHVAADPARLHQVFWNVLKNAIKFTPEAGLIRIHTRRLDGGRCEVRIQDTGMGITPEVLPRIFDAFEQGDATVTRQFGGLGLGLAISKALMELHQGSIRAESEGAGRGSTFIIELPGAVPPATKPADAATARKAGMPPVRLLLVEDHADTAHMLARLLRAEGFTVIQAGDVASAVGVAERETFDVLISDLGLPDGDGFEVMRRVRLHRQVPGIAMSGYGMDEDVRRSREAGFTTHLVKPVEVAQLSAEIRRMTETRG